MDRRERIASNIYSGKRRLVMRTDDGRLPEWAKDAISTEVRIVIGWQDRLRLLFGAHALCEIVTYCETPPGQLQTLTEVHIVRAKRPPKRPSFGYVTDGLCDDVHPDDYAAV